MNVYEIVSGCEEEAPSGKVRALFACVTFQAKDEEWLLRELQGKPFSKPWRTLELRFDKPKLAHADFPEFDYPALVCGERAMAIVGDLLRETGELFPVQVRGDQQKYQLHNIARMEARLLDHKKTAWQTIGAEKCVEVPAFHADRIGAQLKLFKIPEDHGLGIYCVERTGKDGEFKALVDRHGLTGLRFKLVWTDGKTASGKQTKRVPATRPDKPKMSDRPLNASEQRDIDLSIQRGRALLKLTPKASTKKTQEAIRDAIDATSLGKKKLSKKAAIDLAVNLGCLWGQTVCDALSWQWCCLKLADGSETCVIVTPSRSHMVSPLDFVLEQLQKRLPEENTSMLLFNLLKSKKLDPAKAKSYMRVG